MAEKMFQGHAESCLTVQRISNLSSTISLLLTKGQHMHSFLLGLNLPLNSQRLRLDPPSVTDYCYHVLFFLLLLLLSNAQKGTARVNTVDIHRKTCLCIERKFMNRVRIHLCLQVWPSASASGRLPRWQRRVSNLNNKVMRGASEF